jgi:flagellin-specific chaperone FliS
MNPYQKYRRQEEDAGWTRMDLLIALYDKAIERLDKAEIALRAGDKLTAVPLLAKTQLIVAELAAGVRIDVNPENGTNMLRLYEYVTTQMSLVTVDSIQNSRKVMQTLRDGFESVRAEANELERTGRLPSAGRVQMVLTTA